MEPGPYEPEPHDGDCGMEQAGGGGREPAGEGGERELNQAKTEEGNRDGLKQRSEAAGERKADKGEGDYPGEEDEERRRSQGPGGRRGPDRRDEGAGEADEVAFGMESDHEVGEDRIVERAGRGLAAGQVAEDPAGQRAKDRPAIAGNLQREPGERPLQAREEQSLE